MLAKQQNLMVKLRRLLKDALIIPTPMPLTPEISLYLLNHDYRQEALTDEASKEPAHGRAALLGLLLVKRSGAGPVDP